MKRKHTVLLSVILLTLLEQMIKIYINQYWRNADFVIIPKLLSFHPYQNTEYSWINNISNLGVGFLEHIILNVLLLIIIAIAYDFIKRRYTMDKILSAVFTVLIAGALCSLIDKSLWGGSLDYIELEGFFIFDLKDVYLSIFEVAVIYMIIFNYKGIHKLSGKELFKEFKLYLKERLLSHSGSRKANNEDKE